MSLSVASITIDCHNAQQVADFWSAAFDVPLDPEPAPSEFFTSLGRSNPDAHVTMMFIQVPESKTVKNRMHLDLQADDRASEVERLVGLGATLLSDNDEWGVRWSTLSDPEGNEFCVANH